MSAGAGKREHDASASGDIPMKRAARDYASNRILLVGFSCEEFLKYYKLIKDDDWTATEIFSDSITHLVIKDMGGLQNSRQLLPIYWAVLKDIWLLKPSFLTHLEDQFRKSPGNRGLLHDEKDHEYTGQEPDSDVRAKAEYPSMCELMATRNFIRNRKANGSAPILGSEPFSKMVILAGRSNRGKSRKGQLKMVMQAAGATVVDDMVFKMWRAQMKKGRYVDRPSIVIVVDEETNMPGMGLDDETIRELLKGRTPLFFEEFIMHIFKQTMISNTEDLLLQSFVFIHENMKGVDPDGKLQARVMGDEVSDDEEITATVPPAECQKATISIVVGEESLSPITRIKGYPWRLRLHTQKNYGTKVYELFLRCEKSVEAELWDCEANIEIKNRPVDRYFKCSSIDKKSQERLLTLYNGSHEGTRVEVEIEPDYDGNKFNCRPVLGLLEIRDGCLLIGNRKLYVNKQTLAAQSPYFDRLFNGNFMEENINEILIGDVSAAEFTNLMRMVYGDNGRSAANAVLTAENVHKYLELVDRFDLKIVKDAVVNWILSSSSPFSTPDKLLFAEQNGYTTCKDRIISHCTAVQLKELSEASEHSHHLSRETLNKLFKKSCDALIAAKKSIIDST